MSLPAIGCDRAWARTGQPLLLSADCRCDAKVRRLIRLGGDAWFMVSLGSLVPVRAESFGSQPP